MPEDNKKQISDEQRRATIMSAIAIGKDLKKKLAIKGLFAAQQTNAPQEGGKKLKFLESSWTLPVKMSQTN